MPVSVRAPCAGSVRAAVTGTEMRESMYNILICDDEKDIVNALKIYLNDSNYHFLEAFDGEEAVHLVDTNEVHLVLMDIRLPFHNGFYWCTEIRKVSKLPMIFVSSMNDNMNLVMAINMGGDDFITKPFDLNVLTVKIQAMLRRTYEFAGESHMLEHQGVWLNLSDGTLTYEEQILELSKNERKILQTLLENPGAIVTRENLMMALWESDVYVDENTLSVNVNRLRRKLETIGLTDFILTRKGIGYQIKNGS